MKNKILFIDDDENVLLISKLMIESLGYDIILANGGIQGLEALQTNKNIGLIFLDLMMPDINGIEVLRTIKSINIFQKIPVILQTGAVNKDEINQAYQLGISGFLPKPYEKKNLKAIIEKTFLSLQRLTEDKSDY